MAAYVKTAIARVHMLLLHRLCALSLLSPLSPPLSPPPPHPSCATTPLTHPVHLLLIKQHAHAVGHCSSEVWLGGVLGHLAGVSGCSCVGAVWKQDRAMIQPRYGNDSLCAPPKIRKAGAMGNGCNRYTICINARWLVVQLGE